MALGRSKTSEGVRELLAEPRFELMPFDSFDEQTAHLPNGASIAITMSPNLSVDRTVEATEEAMADGFEVIPHIAARYIEGEEHLEEVVDRLEAAGVTDIFVPGGDLEEPAGKYDSAYSMLVDLDEMDHPFERIGITGYPEGHAFIEDDTLAEHMEKKEPYADYITTQLCYDPNAVIDWVDEIRGRGVELPIEVGIPGVMKYQRLLNISQKVGVGDSVRFLRKTTGIFGFIKQLIGSRGQYKPDDLVDGLGEYANDDRYDIEGIHIYTFNQVPDTEDWRTSKLDS